MAVIWLDVTTILGWRRPAVGVVRTEAECAAHALQLIRSGELIKFCAFDFSKGYFAVEEATVVAALSRISSVHGGSGGVSDAKKQLQLPIEHRLKQKLMQVIDRLPLGLKSRVYAYLQPRRSAVVEGARALKQMLRSLRTMLTRLPEPGIARGPVEAGEVSAPFRAEDTYISMGLDWDQKDFSSLCQLKKRLNFKVILFCYDVIPTKLPHLCVGDVASRFALYFSNVAWCADKILCISECSKRDLQALLSELGAPQPRMEVVRLGCDLPKEAVKPCSKALRDIMDQPYFLFVSTIERRKNHEVLYRAYARLVDRGVTNLPLLVFVGMPGWGVGDLLKDIQLDPRTQKFIRILNNVEDSDLTHLYQGAHMTLYPSLYEGWGLPVAESLAFGKFCLAANSASIPEVGGEFVEYLDPWNVEAWADRLLWYIEHPCDVESKQKRIAEAYVVTSWADTACSVFERLRPVASQ
ncbi:glycosyltransferase family 1 protein [Pseudomonas asiatica]|uniref:glycosyltransferase family 4 protein n=1 Tax=Pseudomonas TaxID=286 RepID=UPI001BAE5D58|nr:MULTISPECIES: glycosyltransferase family 1 protein [Pseudomonas]QUN69216.1 glycosyltransferase family 4 protein [Pseudomonas sp. JS425]WJM54979.1 glycosyltransferase family 1 protein [Pseudomonas asiatica]